MNHKSVNTDLDLQLKVNKEILEDNIENVTFIRIDPRMTGLTRFGAYLYARKLILKYLKCKNNITTYFIGCFEWNFNEKFYQFINIKENVDLNLLQQLLDGLYGGESEEPTNDCYTILTYLYYTKTTIKQGLIIQKTCDVKYFKIILLNIKSCLYVILILKGIYSHLPFPSSRVPLTICSSCLQKLIYQANDNNSDF
ncbi:hypothetical protein RhiirA1_476703 [Rhizophagus irregularis]|uniref:Uncharacterized protein n=1 Tax=Rhizophagus irregularis TaxID=588596 RepID=A0A2N0QUP0_9GLOM|nr:hypothetical protein RhiirA1_476703 [Rhizophagus irregularis]